MYLRSVTAIILLTLSWCGFASQCNEKEWNKALVSQHSLERQYNLLAAQYNQWLPSFRQSVFLHQEFSQQELNYLWAKNSNQFQQKVDQQISTAIHSRQVVNDLLEPVSSLPMHIKNQANIWKHIETDCGKDRLITNQVVAQRYIKSVQLLGEELSVLKQKLETMTKVYDKEILVLQNLRNVQP